MNDTSAELKEALFNDATFEEYRKERQDMDVLCDLMEFKWVLTAQIRAQQQFNTPRSDEHWEKKITSLVIRAKSRIAQVKRDLRAAGLGEKMDDALMDLREDRDADE